MVSIFERYEGVPPEERVEITLPRAERLMLIALASSCPSLVVPVFDDFSEPARSTKESLPLERTPVFVLVDSIMMAKIRCERDDSAFIAVLRTFLPDRPASNISSAYATSRISTSVTPGIISCPLIFFGSSFVGY